MIVEKIPYGFVDAEGDVKPLADLQPDDKFYSWPMVDHDSTTAVKSLKKHKRGLATRPTGRSNPEITGRDIAYEIDEAIRYLAENLGRELSDSEEAVIARRVEATLRK